MEKFSYKLPSFEGPLDLLLYLISKNKLSIYEIKIAELLDQYMEQISLMQEENIDIATEFLEMAARLVHIKSVSLLPKQEEAQELTKELTGELIEYSKMKSAAKMFSQCIGFEKLVRIPENIGIDYTYHKAITPVEVYSAYINATGRGKRLREKPKEESFSKIVSKEDYISVTSKIVKILRKLIHGTKLKYENIFSGESSKSGIVATFLALLELIHGKRVSVDDENGQVLLTLNDGGAVDGKK